LVKLKIGRRRIKDVAKLLRLKPNPKRFRQDEDPQAPPAKRQKASDTLGVPGALATRSPAFKSPAAKTSKARDVVTPPKKVNGTAALKRTESEGHVNTPASKGERNGIATSVGKMLSGSAQAEAAALRREYGR
jgi:hypothetical protein